MTYCYATSSTYQYKIPQALFRDIQTSRPAMFPVRCSYYILQGDACLPAVLTQPSCVFCIDLETTFCDTLKMKITNFLFNRRFYEFYFSLWNCTPNWILRTVLFSPSLPTAFISTSKCLSKFRIFHKILFALQFLSRSNLLIGMYCGQASLLPVRATTDLKGHKQATNTGIENPQLIFSGKFLKYCTITHIKHGVQITTSVDYSPVPKCPVSWYFHCERRKS